MPEKIAGYMTVRFPIVEEYDSGDWERDQGPSSYYDLGDLPAEVTFDAPDDVIKSVAITDYTGLLYEGTHWQEDVTAALDRLVPDLEENMAHHPNESSWARTKRFADMKVIRNHTTDGEPNRA